jgi:hypothetical protein
MKSIHRLLAFFAAMGLLGCASPLNITYYSNPSGAALYQGSQMFGYCPITLQYTVTRDDKSQGSKLLQETTACWVSGAVCGSGTIRADLRQYGRNQQFTFTRPVDAPGLDMDVNFAIEQQRNAILQRQAQAQEIAAQYQLLGMLNQQTYQQQQLNQQRQQLRNEQYNSDRSGSGTINNINSGETYQYNWKER